MINNLYVLSTNQTTIICDPKASTSSATDDSHVPAKTPPMPNSDNTWGSRRYYQGFDTCKSYMPQNATYQGDGNRVYHAESEFQTFPNSVFNSYESMLAAMAGGSYQNGTASSAQSQNTLAPANEANNDNESSSSSSSFFLPTTTTHPYSSVSFTPATSPISSEAHATSTTQHVNLCRYLQQSGWASQLSYYSANGTPMVTSNGGQQYCAADSTTRSCSQFEYKPQLAEDASYHQSGFYPNVQNREQNGVTTSQSNQLSPQPFFCLWVDKTRRLDNFNFANDSQVRLFQLKLGLCIHFDYNLFHIVF
ncbi:hypothetical protein Ciccas_001954 [Cichlidogyrus casuarinus]|uniref:Uncharacterized protein n=1 Tax=Cichlidogyrus casuarinus TaxID=1844966 RepID=A0ABD2QIL3_9PLAT